MANVEASIFRSIDDLKDELASKVAESSSKDAVIDSLRQQVSQAEYRNFQIEAQYRRVLQDCNELQQGQYIAVSHRCKELESRNTVLTAQVNLLECALQAKRVTHEQMAALLIKHDKREAELQAELKRMEIVRKKLGEDSNHYRDCCKRAEKWSSEISERYSRLLETFEEVREERDNLKARCGESNTESCSMPGHLRLISANSDAQKAIKDLKAQIDFLHSRHMRLVENCSKLEGVASQSAIQKNQLHAICSDLQAQNTDLEDFVHAVFGRNRDLEAYKVNAESSNARLRQQINQLEAFRQKALSTFARLRQQIDSAKGLVNAYIEERARGRSQLASNTTDVHTTPVGHDTGESAEHSAVPTPGSSADDAPEVNESPEAHDDDELYDADSSDCSEDGETPDADRAVGHETEE